jgi:hypothetical protein
MLQAVMQNNILASLARLGDDDLAARVKSLAARERDATAHLIAHLAEMDTRDIHLRAGFPRLYDYCLKVLHLSEWEAWNRIEAARVARRFPVLFDMLEEGSVHLSGIKLLAPHLTDENHRKVLESARWKSKLAIAEIVARLHPLPDVPTSVVHPGVRRGRARGDDLATRYRLTVGPSAAVDGIRNNAGRPTGAAGEAHHADAAGSTAIQAPAHDQRRDAREAPPREGHARARRLGRG